MSEREFKKFDTFAQTDYFVRLAQDPRVFVREDGSHDVVLTFVDTSRFDNLEDLWVDARVRSYLADRAKKLRKGDTVQVIGKLRFKKMKSGEYRGKIYDAVFNALHSLAERDEIQPAGAEEPNFE
jgi:single-stranded DNA-binding protein